MFYVFDHPSFGIWEQPNGEFPSGPEYVRCSRPVDNSDGYWCPCCYNIFHKFTWITVEYDTRYKCEICGKVSYKKDPDVIAILEKN